MGGRFGRRVGGLDLIGATAGGGLIFLGSPLVAQLPEINGSKEASHAEGEPHPRSPAHK